MPVWCRQPSSCAALARQESRDLEKMIFVVPEHVCDNKQDILLLLQAWGTHAAPPSPSTEPSQFTFGRLKNACQGGDGFPIPLDFCLISQQQFITVLEKQQKSGRNQAKSSSEIDSLPNSSDLGEYRGIRRILGGSREMHSPKSAFEHVSTVQLHTKMSLPPYIRADYDLKTVMNCCCKIKAKIQGESRNHRRSDTGRGARQIFFAWQSNLFTQCNHCKTPHCRAGRIDDVAGYLIVLEDGFGGQQETAEVAAVMEQMRTLDGTAMFGFNPLPGARPSSIPMCEIEKNREFHT